MTNTVNITVLGRLVPGRVMDRRESKIDGLPTRFFRVAILDEGDRKQIERAIGQNLDCHGSAWFPECEIERFRPH